MLDKYRFIPIMIVIGMCLFSINAFAQSSNTTYIEQLEDQLFSTKYTNESTDQRLARLEETIFGIATPQESVDMRIEKLQALLAPQSSTDSKETQQTETASFNTHSSDQNSTHSFIDQDSNTQNQQANSILEYGDNNSNNNTYSGYGDYDSTTTYTPSEEDQEIEDYPAISYLENQVFNKSYKGEDITKRLERLEQNIFNKTKSNLSLSERLDGLKVAITGTTNIQLAPRMPGNDNLSSGRGSKSEVTYHSGNTGSSNTYYQTPKMNPQQYYQSPEMNTFQQNSNYPSTNEEYAPIEPGYNTGQISQESLMEITNRLEEAILGQSFPGQPLNSRLDRLEMQIFNRTTAGYTPESRIERLVAVTAAEATSDPHDLKKIKRLRKIQTGLTVGGILFSILRGFLF